MDYKELNEAISQLDRLMYNLENTYIDNEGECTEETEKMEEEIALLNDLLTTEGVDMLGGWLKSKEDKKKALKAEKDYITRQMAAIDQTMDFIKSKVNEVMSATGKEKIKGDRGYAFALTTSCTTSVDKEILKEMFLDKVTAKLRGGKRPIIPEDVTITLGASVKALPEGAELPRYYDRSETPSVRFTKPRADKEA